MRLLTIKETAEILRVTPQWLYQLARKGRLPSLRIGRRVRVEEEKLRDWLDRGCDQPDGPGRPPEEA